MRVNPNLVRRPSSSSSLFWNTFVPWLPLGRFQKNGKCSSMEHLLHVSVGAVNEDLKEDEDLGPSKNDRYRGACKVGAFLWSSCAFYFMMKCRFLASQLPCPCFLCLKVSHSSARTIKLLHFLRYHNLRSSYQLHITWNALRP